MKVLAVTPAPTPPAAGERPWHRVALRLHTEGWTTKDIAKELKQKPADVTALFISPFGKQFIAQAVEKDEQVVSRILQGAGLDSIYTLIELREGASSETVRYNSAKALLEHGHGRPLQRVQKTSEKPPQDPAEEFNRLREELKEELAS